MLSWSVLFSTLGLVQSFAPTRKLFAHRHQFPLFFKDGPTGFDDGDVAEWLRPPPPPTWPSILQRAPTAPDPQAWDEADVWHMECALNHARRGAAEGEVPVGAVLVAPDGRTVLASTHNRVAALSDVTAHAELLAIREASKVESNWRLLNCTLYCTLEPCAMCLAALQLARVGRVVYGAKDVRLGAVESYACLADALPHPSHPDMVVAGGLLEGQSAGLLKAFFVGRRDENNGAAAAQRTTATTMRSAATAGAAAAGTAAAGKAAAAAISWRGHHTVRSSGARLLAQGAGSAVQGGGEPRDSGEPPVPPRCLESHEPSERPSDRVQERRRRGRWRRLFDGAAARSRPSDTFTAAAANDRLPAADDPGDPAAWAATREGASSFVGAVAGASFWGARRREAQEARGFNAAEASEAAAAEATESATARPRPRTRPTEAAPARPYPYSLLTDAQFANLPRIATAALLQPGEEVNEVGDVYDRSEGGERWGEGEAAPGDHSPPLDSATRIRMKQGRWTVGRGESKRRRVALAFGVVAALCIGVFEW